jgi:cbb3-type cytochrome oxidase subunit 3
MGLSGIMGNAGLEIFAEIGLVIFLVVFAAVVWNTFRKGRKEELEEAGRIPLDDFVPVHERDGDSDEVTS